MKNILKTILAATFLAGNTLAAPTPEEFAGWVANDNRNSPEAQAYLAELLAKNTWSNGEALAAIFLQTGVMLPDYDQSITEQGLEAIQSPDVQSAIAAALPKSAYLSLFKKVYIDKTTEGWTDEDILRFLRNWWAGALADRPAALVLVDNLDLPMNHPFVKRVVDLITAEGAPTTDLFLKYRASLPINEQLALTQSALSAYVKKGNEDPERLAALTAELVALKMLVKP